MAQTLISNEKSSSQQGLLALFALLMVGIGGWYVYTTYFAAPATTETSEMGVTIAITKVDWTKELFGNAVYLTLKNPLTEPLVVGRKGNPAPFVEGNEAAAPKK